MKFRGSSQVRFGKTSGGAPRVLRASCNCSQFGGSQPCPRASATRTPKSSVQLGAKLKFSGRSQQVGLSSAGPVQAATSSRSSPCVSSRTSRTLAGMQSRFSSAHAARRSQSSSVQCHLGQQQDPAPNPSIKRTCLRQAAYLQR